jgi:CHAD domain-containing protein
MPSDAYNAQFIVDASRRLLADAATRCHAPDRESEHNVHEIRKDLKKVRAYWRLMRYALGKAHSKAGNERCKQAAKQLAAARDHGVMLETLDDIGRDVGNKTAMACGRAKQAMQANVDGDVTDGIGWAQVEALIQNDDAAWSGIDAEAIDPTDIKRGWKRTRKKARKGFESARGKPSAEALHHWRKWAKRWMQQEELLHPHKQKRIGRLDELGDALGRHHDLAVLTHRLWRNDRFGGKPHRRVRKTIGKRQAGLEKQTIKLGKKLFA